MELRHVVTREEDGRKLVSVLRGAMQMSSGMVKRLKWVGGLTVNGQAEHTDYRVHENDLVEALLELGEAPAEILPEPGELDILYEDSGLIALNKPAGMIVHPSHSRFTGTLANRLVHYLAAQGEAPVCHAVNRIDRDTSGIVLFAKNSHMKALASKALKEAEKTYFAMVMGVFEPLSGTIDLPIVRLTEGDMFRAVSPEGQRAVTHYETVSTGTAGGEAVSVLKLKLETGRTHQIRVHCSHLGHPLLGDTLYKTDASEALSRELCVSGQLLHAGRLSMPHPQTGELLDISCPVRAEMQKFLPEGDEFS